MRGEWQGLEHPPIGVVNDEVMGRRQLPKVALPRWNGGREGAFGGGQVPVAEFFIHKLIGVARQRAEAGAPARAGPGGGLALQAPFPG